MREEVGCYELEWGFDGSVRGEGGCLKALSGFLLSVTSQGGLTGEGKPPSGPGSCAERLHVSPHGWGINIILLFLKTGN